MATINSANGQAFDKEHLSFMGRNYGGIILINDKEVKDILQSRFYMTYDVALGISTRSTDNSEYAASYNYPTFGFGISTSDFSMIKLRDDSQIANIHTVYGFFDRPLFRHKRFSLIYMIETGLSTATNPFDP